MKPINNENCLVIQILCRNKPKKKTHKKLVKIKYTGGTKLRAFQFNIFLALKSFFFVTRSGIAVSLKVPERNDKEAMA